jgi:hypothetical protein
VHLVQLCYTFQTVRTKAVSVKIRYQETTMEDGEDFMGAVVTVIFGVCNSVRLL